MDLEQAADSAAAKVNARIVMPAMVGVLSLLLVVVGAMGKRAWDENTKALSKISDKQDTQSLDILQIKSDVRDVNTRLDAQVIRQVETNSKRLDRVETAVEQIQKAVRTP